MPVGDRTHLIWIEYALTLFMLGAPGCVLYSRLKQRKDPSGPKGIGVRMMQMVSLLMIVPGLLVLSLEGIITKDVTGSLLGTIIGYCLSGITSAVPKK